MYLPRIRAATGNTILTVTHIVISSWWHQEGQATTIAPMLNFMHGHIQVLERWSSFLAYNSEIA